MDGIQTNSSVIKRGRGGARPGAGRESISSKMLRDPRYLAARGVTPLFAAEVLSHVIDERRMWQRVFASEDDRIILQALQFLVSMRDGRPAQQINVTSQSISISADSVRKAREIIAEIRGESSAQSIPRLGQVIDNKEDSEDEIQPNASTERRGG